MCRNAEAAQRFRLERVDSGLAGVRVVEDGDDGRQGFADRKSMVNLGLRACVFAYSTICYCDVQRVGQAIDHA